MSQLRGSPPAPSSTSGLVARGSLVNMVAMTVGAVLAFGLTVVASRWLQPKATGELFELIAIFSILAYALALGADTGLTRWISRARAIGSLADIRRIVLIAVVPILLAGMVVGAALWIAAPALAGIFLHGLPRSTAATDIRLIAFGVPLAGISTCVLAAARGFGRMWPYLAVEGLGKPALRIGLVVLVLVLGWGLRGALVAWIIPVALGLAVGWMILAWLIRKEVPGADRWRPVPGRRPLAAGFWRFAAPRGVAGIFQIVVLWLDILLVGAFLSSYDAGVYAAVSKLAMLGTFALEGTRLAIAPQLSALLARRQQAGAAALFQSATNWLMLASWPVYVLFAIFPVVALGIFGPRYATGAAALVVLSLAMLVNLGTGNVTVVLLMGGKSSWNVANTLAALVVNVGLNLVLLPRIGIVGAAIAWAASILVDNVAAAVEVWWFLDLSPFGAGYGLAAAAGGGCFAVTGLAARAVLGQTLLGLVAAALTGLIAFAAVAYVGRGRLQLVGLFAAIRPGRRQAGRTGPGPGEPGPGPGPGPGSAGPDPAGPGRHRARAQDLVPGDRAGRRAELDWRPARRPGHSSA
jgi:O-antigen/teichoic acid export membrane protein